MANEGLSQLSTVIPLQATVAGTVTSTTMRSYGAELLFLYCKYTAGVSTAWTVDESTDGGTTWVAMLLNTRTSVTNNDNFRMVVRCGSYDRRFRVRAGAASGASTIECKAAFNRNPRPVLV
jgi:hypothetical protein